MKCTIEARSKGTPWAVADVVDSLETAANVARAWYAKGYVVRIKIERA